MPQFLRHLRRRRLLQRQRVVPYLRLLPRRQLHPRPVRRQRLCKRQVPGRRRLKAIRARTVKIAKLLLSARGYCAKAERPVVLVPTMGALHDGHAALIRHARMLAGRRGTVVVSIFVNPMQFGPKEDFSKYPRAPRQDLEACKANGADLVFRPPVEQVYHEDRSVFVDESSLSRRLCGASRPGHFRGVCTVVAKLFLILRPHVAVFGEKDWQQLAIIRRMVRDLNFSIRIVGYPTVREPDGLAMSSRNKYLTAEERRVAPGIYAALSAAALRESVGEVLSVGRCMLERIPGARIDYLELVDAETIEQANDLRRPTRLAVAVFLGKARLIDNIAVSPRS
jgi:pantoate--beta-alanine ligase